MGHIFISYSHKDKIYVQRLQKVLQKEGFEVWIDDRVDYGTRWPKVIQDQLDSCDAFIVIVSEYAYDSEWVQNEVARAKRKGKAFFPLLFQGEPWLSVESIQYVDVTNNSLPNEKFYKRLETVTTRKKDKHHTPQSKRISKRGGQVSNKILAFNTKESIIDKVERYLKYMGIQSVSRVDDNRLIIHLTTAASERVKYTLYFYFIDSTVIVESPVFRNVSGSPESEKMFQKLLLSYNGSTIDGTAFGLVPLREGTGLVLRTSQDCSNLTAQDLFAILNHFNQTFSFYIPKIKEAAHKWELKFNDVSDDLQAFLKDILKG